jgi:hypothetical protein
MTCAKMVAPFTERATGLAARLAPSSTRDGRHLVYFSYGAIQRPLQAVRIIESEGCGVRMVRRRLFGFYPLAMRHKMQQRMPCATKNGAGRAFQKTA